MERIVSHPNYSGLPDAIDENGQIRWNAPSNRPPGRWQDLRDRRLLWWKQKAKENGIKIEGEWISKVAKVIHPFKEKPCQTCGRSMSLDYVYPTKNTLQKINKMLSPPNRLKYEDFLTIFEVVSYLTKKLGDKGFTILVDIFPDLERVEKTDEAFIRFFSKKIVPSSPRGKLSPGAMSNAPDRLDGFHTYNLCCRHKQDKGRSSENLRTYTDDRRAFEFWCEGDWAAANLLMTMGGIGRCAECNQIGKLTADHVGPISLGFAHLPWFRPLCSSCNSSKGNRLSFSNVSALIKKEASGINVSSFQIKSLWNQCKNLVDSDDLALKLSKLLRINQHYYLLLLKEIFDLGHPEILLLLLSPELSDERISFISLNQTNFTFKELRRSRRADTYSKSKAARMIRIAFDSLDDYGSREKRNIHEVPAFFELPLRKKVLFIVTKELESENNEDKELGNKLFNVLKSSLGPEERSALIEKIFNGTYKPKNNFSQSLAAIREYLNEIGTFLARNKF